MPEYYQGPNNSAQLKAVTLVLPVVATLLVGWRISWRAKKKVIVLSDYLLVLGLVSFCFRFRLGSSGTNNSVSEFVPCWL